MSDLETLRRHVGGQDPRAFEELVARHLDWVYCAARRQVRDAHLADDVTQAVFLALARQAGRLADGVTLTAWLFQVTRRASAMAVRSAGRRRRHERRAALMNDEAADAGGAMDEQEWERLAPVLDEAVGQLGEADRRSILLRYYERKSFAEVGAALAVGEAAARKRVSRAVEKLRGLVGGKGVACTAAALAAGLTNHTTHAAPASTAAAVAATVAAPADASPAVAALAKGALNMLAWSRIRVVAGAGLMTVAAVGLSVGLAQVAGPAKREAAKRPATAATSPAAKPAAGAAASPPAAPAAGTPKAVIVAAYVAGLAGDEVGLLDAFGPLTAEQEATLRQVVRVLAAANDLQEAVAAQYGEQAAAHLNALGSGVKAADVFAAPETVTGDRAVVDLGPSGPGQVPLERVGGAWKVSPRVLATVNAAAVAQWDRKVPAIRALAKDVAAGKYPTPADLRQAVGPLMR
jgi:RNA polymerase sigma factor (sigma-70 family)